MYFRAMFFSAVVSIFSASTYGSDFKSPMNCRKAELESIGERLKEGTPALNRISPYATVPIKSRNVNLQGEVQENRAQYIKEANKPSDLPPGKAMLDIRAIEEAKKSGRARVSIYLRRWSVFNTDTVRPGESDVTARKEKVKRTFEEILEKIEPGSSKALDIIDGFPVGFVTLRLESLLKLYKNPDPRIERVDNNNIAGYLS